MTTASYFTLNTEAYKGLIDRLVKETSAIRAPQDNDLDNGRRDYILTAIAKGAPLASLPEEIAAFNAKQLADAAEALPDKEALGWRIASASISLEDRETFARAGERRPAAMRWDDLFPEGKTEIYLPLSLTAQSLDNKVDDYIAAHNQAAAENYSAALAADVLSSAARGTAGKGIDQRQIRRDTDNPKMMQVLNPGSQNESWSPPRSIEKFLQDQKEWALYDDLQLEKTEHVKTKVTVEETATDIGQVANRNYIPADYFLDTNDLMVVVSRDPQKIGEMSTGQRWRSCMATDGINYRYVANDISAGSLVAYVVHRDDADARYPLMRQLIKPFRNDSGETILVPAKVYGGVENTNARTRDTLQTALNDFVSQQNGDKGGQFTMDRSLYEDNQAVVVQLQGDWDPLNIANAVSKYQRGAITEWISELKEAAVKRATGNLGPHGEKPEDMIKALKGKLRRVMDAEDQADGLPRMFFRQMRANSIGAVPEPEAIVTAIAADPMLVERSAAFRALSKSNSKGLEAININFIDMEQVAFVSALTAKVNSPAEIFASNVWAEKVESAQDMAAYRAQTYLENARLTTPGSALDQKVIEGFMRNATLIENVALRFDLYQSAAYDLHSPGLIAQATAAYSDLTLSQDDPRDRLFRFKNTFQANSKALQAIGIAGILRDGENEPDLQVRCDNYVDVAAKAPEDSPEKLQAYVGMVKHAANVSDVDRRMKHYYIPVIHLAPERSELVQDAITGVMDCIDETVMLRWQCRDLCREIFGKSTPELDDRILRYELSLLPGNETRETQNSAYYSIAARANPGSATRREAVTGMLANAGAHGSLSRDYRNALELIPDDPVIKHGLVIELIKKASASKESYWAYREYREAVDLADRDSAEYRQAVAGMVATPEYIRAMTHYNEDRQKKLLVDFKEFAQIFPGKEQLNLYRALTDEISASPEAREICLSEQFKIIQAFDTPQERIADMMALRKVVRTNMNYRGANPTIALDSLHLVATTIIQDITALQTPGERVAAAKQFIENNSTEWFQSKSAEYAKEIKYRAQAERIVLAKGDLSQPHHRTASRLMSLLERDDVSHLMYCTTKAVHSALQGLNVLCKIDQPQTLQLVSAVLTGSTASNEITQKPFVKTTSFQQRSSTSQ